jgi:hypothetical protein
MQLISVTPRGSVDESLAVSSLSVSTSSNPASSVVSRGRNSDRRSLVSPRRGPHCKLVRHRGFKVCLVAFVEAQQRTVRPHPIVTSSINTSPESQCACLMPFTQWACDLSVEQVHGSALRYISDYVLFNNPVCVYEPNYDHLLLLHILLFVACRVDLALPCHNHSGSFDADLRPRMARAREHVLRGACLHCTATYGDVTVGSAGSRVIVSVRTTQDFSHTICLLAILTIRKSLLPVTQSSDFYIQFYSW